MVQRKTLGPKPRPVTPVVGEPGLVIVPAPLTNVQVPVPMAGVLPVNVAVAEQTL
jgi:hypothetical protein